MSVATIPLSAPNGIGKKRVGADARSLGLLTGPRPRTLGRAVAVVIAHKSAIFRAGLAHILAGSRFRVVASVSNPSDLCQGKKFKNHGCVALIGLDEDPSATLSRAFRLKHEIPGLRIVVVAGGCGPEEVLAAIEGGADAYLCKEDITAELLLKSLELVLLGPTVIPRGFLLRSDPVPKAVDELHPINDAASIPHRTEQPPSGGQCDNLHGLSAREKAVLVRLTDGRSNKEIARELDLAEATVKIHVKSLLRKIGAKNRTQAAMWAIRRSRGKDRM
jgi:two-component system, NarL family, nitrate/nitrite response regulator NarL